MAIGRAVVYYARAAHIFSAGIKCRHCTWPKNRSCAHTGFVLLEMVIQWKNALIVCVDVAKAFNPLGVNGLHFELYG